MANTVQWLYAEMKELEEQFGRIEEEKRIQEAVEIAVQLVYERVNIFDGYDLEGYLGCYETEMKNQGVPENMMIAAFAHLISPDLKDEVLELAEYHSDRWRDFAEALIICVNAMNLEEEQLTWEKQKQKADEMRYNVSCDSVPTSIRANLETVVDACLMEDNQLLFKTDTEIMEAVYAKLGLQEAISVQQDLHSAKRDALLQPKKDAMGELSCKLSKREDSHDESTHSKGILQVPYRMCEELREPMVLAKNMFAEFEDPGKEEDAIISAFLCGCDDANEPDDVSGFCDEGMDQDFELEGEGPTTLLIEQQVLIEGIHDYACEDDKILQDGPQVCVIDLEGVSDMGDSNSDVVSEAGCQGSLDLGYLGMLTGCSNNKQGDAMSSVSGLSCNHICEQQSRAWKPVYNDDLEREIESVFLDHTGFNDRYIQGYSHEGPIVLSPSIDRYQEMLGDNMQGMQSVVTEPHEAEYEPSNGYSYGGMNVHDNQHVELQDDNGFNKIDPKLDAILDDALDDFMTYNRSPSSLGSSMVDAGQLPVASEDVQMICKPNDCDVMDPELEAILDDALMDFACMDTKGLGMSYKVAKNVDVIMHSASGTCVKLCDQRNDKVQSIEVCLLPEEDKQATSNTVLCNETELELNAILNEAL